MPADQRLPPEAASSGAHPGGEPEFKRARREVAPRPMHDDEEDVPPAPKPLVEWPAVGNVSMDTLSSTAINKILGFMPPSSLWSHAATCSKKLLHEAVNSGSLWAGEPVDWVEDQDSKNPSDPSEIVAAQPQAPNFGFPVCLAQPRQLDVIFGVTNKIRVWSELTPGAAAPVNRVPSDVCHISLNGKNKQIQSKWLFALWKCFSSLNSLSILNCGGLNKNRICEMGMFLKDLEELSIVNCRCHHDQMIQLDGSVFPQSIKKLRVDRFEYWSELLTQHGRDLPFLAGLRNLEEVIIRWHEKQSFKAQHPAGNILKFEGAPPQMYMEPHIHKWLHGGKAKYFDIGGISPQVIHLFKQMIVLKKQCQHRQRQIDIVRDERLALEGDAARIAAENRDLERQVAKAKSEHEDTDMEMAASDPMAKNDEENEAGKPQAEMKDPPSRSEKF